MLLEARAIHKRYKEIEVLKGVSMCVEKGEIVSIVGASGAGKSTLLHVLAMLEEADAGEIMFSNYPAHLCKGDELARLRNQRIGFVFQFHQLLPEFTALENVCLPAYIGGRYGKAVRKEASDLLNRLGLGERLGHLPASLSGGESQRVAIARALINQPEVVFADEPSGNLDSANSEKLYELFSELSKERKQAFIIATHNTSLADIAHRKLHIRDGQLI